MTEDNPKRKQGRPLKGDAPISPAERQRRRRLIEAARLGALVHIYADRMAYRLDIAEGQIQELKSALREKDHSAYPGLVLEIDFSIKVLRNNLVTPADATAQTTLVNLDLSVRPRSRAIERTSMEAGTRGEVPAAPGSRWMVPATSSKSARTRRDFGTVGPSSSG